jgi:membrane-bound serine protease (ClpP class)
MTFCPNTRNILTTLCFILFSIINSEAQQKIVYQFKIDSEIGPSVTRLTTAAIAEAEKRNAAYILIDMDTYGGLVDDADHIRTALLKTKIPTLVLIRNNAASAGALISIACDSIYMQPGATIGAASVVNQTGELMPEKYQSYMRKKMRATAEQTGRNPLIAEGMTDENLEIDSIKERGKIITFSTQEAIKYGYCNAQVENEEDVLKSLKNNNITIEKHKSSLLESLIIWLVNPAVSGIFLLVIFAGIYFEFKAPGTLLPIAISAVAALIYFAPLYLEGLAANWEILVFILGLILLLVELFVIPGFGVAGISGIVLIVSSLTLALVRNINFDFTFVPQGSVAFSFLLVAVSMSLPLLFIMAFGHQIFASAMFKQISATAEMKTEDGFSIRDNSLVALIGQEGIAATDMRPAGKIDINGVRYDATADSGFVLRGTAVKVIQLRGTTLVIDLINT